MTIYLPALLPDLLSFPAVDTALTEPDGLLAMGGDLSPQRIILAYQSGIFPWYSQGDPLLWWSPSTRAIFPPNTLKLNRTLRKQWQKGQYHITLNQAFSDVVRQCAAPRATQSGTWILPEMQRAYAKLHQLGHAHSIEIWQQEQLVAGLYGIQLGQIFCGESMFNRISNGAKFALIALQQHVQGYAPGWIDCQLPNPFLIQLGAMPLPRPDYLTLLTQLATQPAPATHWQKQRLTLDLSDTAA